MDFVIHSMGLPFNGGTLAAKSLGGSESAAYYLAREIARRGHKVLVWTAEQAEGEYDGVIYAWHGNCSEAAPLGERFTHYALNTPHDVLIIQRHPLGFHKDWASKINVWQLHDLALFRTLPAVHGGLPRIDMVTGVSDWHCQQIKEVYSIAEQAIRTVPNGVDLALYETPAQPIPQLHAKPNRFKLLYQSRPERGLMHLVRPGGIMQKLAEAGSTAELYICGYDNTTKEMAAFYGQLNAWCQQLPNVTHLGALPKATLAQVQRACDVLVYPTSFEEVSCITAMEAMAAGLPMLTSACAALPETCKDAGVELIPLLGSQVNEAEFVEWLKMAEWDKNSPAREGKSLLDQMAYAQKAAAESRTWAVATDTLLREVERCFRERLTPAAIGRHCLEHSDIGFLDWYRSKTRHTDDPIFEAALREREQMFKFVDTPQATLEHYNYWEGWNLDRMEEHGLDIKSEIAGLQHNFRFIGLAQHLTQAMSPLERAGEFKTRVPRVLEFGCAHGHITLALAKGLPKVEFTGVDFMRKSIGHAIRHAASLGLANAKFQAATVDELEGEYDAVIAAEVLEHIYDWRSTLEKLRARCRPGGTVVITTPAGRWEWSGAEMFPKGREHLHHFERADWAEVLKGFRHEISYAPFGAEQVGGQRGSWIVSFVQDPDLALGEIDYARKLRELAPRQTVSLCMIVKDAETTIARTIKSCARYVDEIVISIDPATSDRTEEILRDLQADYPFIAWDVAEGLKATEDGFDAARNHALYRCHGDWIMWMDADEELPHAANLWRLLRPSHYNGFGCPQVHYSLQPAAVLSTDFPCRLFRNHRGIKFYGVVHEHPEDAPGKSITPAGLASDLQFLHAGYVDEPTRRNRYSRNLPLLMRDVEKYPDRTLNRFLLLRDTAQAMMYEVQQHGGPLPHHAEQCDRAVDIFTKMVDDEKVPLRMVLDAVQYYSAAVELQGGGFLMNLNWTMQMPQYQTMGAKGETTGRFHDHETGRSLLNRIYTESTRHYASPYA